MRPSAFLLPALLALAAPLRAAELPDIRTIEPDLVVPPLFDASPAAGLRVRQRLDRGGKPEELYHVLYLPTDWRLVRPGEARFPVLVEFAGNGGYANAYGDTSSGRPEGSNLGYGLSAGRGFLWLCLPYLDASGKRLATKWWGDPPDYDPEPTLAYCREAVKSVCQDFGGDEARVVLCGFSRGAIACNYLGLHDETTSPLWCAFFAYSHYDGVRRWPYPGSDREAAKVRLGRLGHRPQFICGEGSNARETEGYLRELAPDADLSFFETGFRNHNDAWILRPSEAREEARRWLGRVVSAAARPLADPQTNEGGPRD